MSVGGPTSPPSACSGDMKPGEPTTMPVCVSALASTAREIPKSMTRGPSGASNTFDGFRSLCTMPAAWIARSPSASPAANSSTALTGNGPCCDTASASEGPATNAVASQGAGPSTSASITGAVNWLLTLRATAISRRKRVRNSGSAARSARTTFTATGRPPSERPRNTRPMPPTPSCPRIRYGPITCGSPGCSSCHMLIPSLRKRTTVSTRRYAAVRHAVHGGRAAR